MSFPLSKITFVLHSRSILWQLCYVLFLESLWHVNSMLMHYREEWQYGYKRFMRCFFQIWSGLEWVRYSRDIWLIQSKSVNCIVNLPSFFMRLTVSIDWQYPGILHVNTERSSYTKAWKQTARLNWVFFKP